AERRRAGRLVHGEADLLPGLIVDRYADCLSVQTLIEATDARRDLFANLLQELVQPRAVVERNDVRVRAHEGLPQRKGMLRGDPPGPVEFLEGEITLSADLLEGQKTGAFLDQAENRVEAGRYARGRVLDPPAFAKAKSSIDPALRGYKEINLRAFHLLNAGGVLITCSCSFHIDDAQFETTVLAAAGDAKRSVQVVERRGAARDHPTLLGVPETRYLKCLILRVA